MFKNFILVTLRSIARDKSYALINILGLTIGFACCLVIWLYLKSEFTFDRHFELNDRIYRVVAARNANGTTSTSAKIHAQVAPLMLRDSSAIENFVRFSPEGNIVITHDGTQRVWEDVYTVDQSVFSIFNYDIIYGDQREALTQPNSVAINEPMARYYFGDDNPLNKSLTIHGESYTVTAVFSPPPSNTHLIPTALLARESPGMNPPVLSRAEIMRGGPIFIESDYTYLLLSPEFDPNNFSALSDRYFESHLKPTSEQFNTTIRYYLEALGDIHLNSTVQQDLPRGNKNYLYTLAAICLLILVVSCINYINLSTARYSRRLKEIGVRKLLGSNRLTLFGQFTFESIIYCQIALLIAYVVIEISMRLIPFSQSVALRVTTADTHHFSSYYLPALFALGIGLIAGVYPAYIISSQNPRYSRRQRISNPFYLGILRKSLVFSQFSITISVVAVTYIMYQQVDFIANKSLGFDDDNKFVTTIYRAENVAKLPLLQQEIVTMGGVKNFATTSQLPGQVTEKGQMFIEGNDGEFQVYSFANLFVDPEFLNAFGSKIVEGSWFNGPAVTGSQRSVVVNQALVKHLGWDTAIGKRIGSRPVTGVIQDFNFQSLRHLVEPLVLTNYSPPNFAIMPDSLAKTYNRVLVMEFDEGLMQEAIQNVESAWLKIYPDIPFSYTPLKQLLNKQYETDMRLIRLIGLLSLLCLFTASLGLFGLTAYTTEQRAKEISIRKVLGASTLSIVSLLSIGIIIILLPSAFVGSGISYYFTDSWLNNFAYRINTDLSVFIYSSLAVSLLALLIVSWQSYWQASKNPVDNLQYE